MRTREIIVCALEVKAIEAVIIGNPNSGSAGEEGYLERFAETRGAGGLEIAQGVSVQDRLPNLVLLLPLLSLLLMSL
jgi:hypothetical protein